MPRMFHFPDLCVVGGVQQNETHPALCEYALIWFNWGGRINQCIPISAAWNGRSFSIPQLISMDWNSFGVPRAELVLGQITLGISRLCIPAFPGRWTGVLGSIPGILCWECSGGLRPAPGELLRWWHLVPRWDRGILDFQVRIYFPHLFRCEWDWKFWEWDWKFSCT